MANAAGGAETSKLTTAQLAAGNFCEILSQAGTSTAFASIQAPTGHGWVYSPGAGSFANANWTASITFATNFNNSCVFTWRAYKYSGGVYTSLGSGTANQTSTAKTTYSFTITSAAAATLSSGDLIYIDLWYNDPTGVASDTVTVYVSTSSSQGVANDVQITTSNFTASGGGGGTHHIVCDGGFGGVFS